jgi:GLPGLI family protein
MTLKKYILSCIASILCLGVFAQNFEGKISAKMEAIEVPDDMKGMEGMMKQEMTIYSKKEKNRTELKNMMSTTVIISDTVKKETIILVDMMGQKTAMKQTIESGASTSAFGFEVEGGTFQTTSETKIIAGYKCFKGIYTFPSETESSVIIWYTNDITNPDFGSDVPGMIMEYTMKMEGITMQFTVTAVTKQTVPDSLFEIPAGYNIKTEEEFQNSIPTMGK